MARRSVPRRSMPGSEPQGSNPGGGNSGDGTARERGIEALMALLAERRFEEIGLNDIAARAGLSLAELRSEFSSVVAILAAHIKDVDQKVLSGGDADMAEEPPRERLFDVLMRRLEVLAPHKEAVRSLLRSATRNAGLAATLNGFALRSQQWMLTAADIRTTGVKGMVRTQGLALLFARVLCVWVDDEDPGLARTMAALDRELARAERWSALFDDLCLIPESLCRAGRWRARRRRETGEEPIAI